MKAANTKAHHNGDDAYFDRLFSYFRSQFTEKITRFVPIKSSVILLETKKQAYIMKGYPAIKRLKLQEALTATLRKEGFSKTYEFLNPPAKEQLFFEGTYFGCIEYIVPNKVEFSFHTQKNRQEGLDLLSQFHNTTKAFEQRYRTLIPYGDLMGKWAERQQIFSNNLPILGYFMKEPFISEMAEWATWSLSGLDRHQASFQKEPNVILHGDVAHHNFLRDIDGRLRLIDFDLVNIGPASFDYLQYANRILPYIDWSFEKLFSHKQLQKYLDNQAFLFALAYPADIFREWNRVIREKTYSNQKIFKQVMTLSIGQFYSRKKFIDKLKDRLK
jgi:thiamine kinase-like enzyme